MSLKIFLDNLTPQAIQYINSIAKTNNSESYRKLKKIFNDQSIELKSFEDTNIDIIHFNWSGIERDRNWWWQAHALPFLNWYVDSYDLQSEEERKKYFSLCILAINNWNTKTKNYDSPLAWHDHGTAFRSRNIVNWITFCYIRNIDVINSSNNINLSELIIEHLNWLLESENYSKYTNHGFDQSMIILTISAMYYGEQLETHRLVSRQRLEAEIRFAFTEEGVHKENSPGYQKFMLARLKQLCTLALLDETVISELAENYIEKAEEFLRVITLPNGYLPMIGDTRGEDLGLKSNYDGTSDYVVYDYSHSGYIIVKGKDKSDKEFFILLKNTHESNYHRHDDDMMIYLFYNNQTVFGDGGLYNFQENDPRRKQLRSYLSHSVPYIESNAIRNQDQLLRKPIIKNNGDLSFYLESAMFGKTIRREVSISLLPSLELNIVDNIVEKSEDLICSNFFFENDYPLFVNKNNLNIEFSGFKLHIDYSNNASLSIEKGWNDVELGKGAYVSKIYGEISRAMRVSISGSKKKIYFS